MRGLALGFALALGIGFVDLITGPEFGFAFFYFIPILPIAWTFGLWPGLIIATASAAMWFVADATLKPDQLLPAVTWNATSRLAIFLGGVYLIDRLRNEQMRMALVDAQRDEFLRVLEHELTTPAQEMIEGLNAAQARGTLDVVEIDALRHHAESLLFLTRDFVALGQAQAQRLRLRSVPVDIAQLVSEVARQRGGRTSIPATLPSDGLVVVGDPDRLRQALANTVAEVLAETGRADDVSINVRGRGTDALVTISSAAPAIATRVVDGDHVRVSLRLAGLLVEAMGGSVVMERAALGKGTRVTLRVPLADPAGSVPLEPAAARRVQ